MKKEIKIFSMKSQKQFECGVVHYQAAVNERENRQENFSQAAKSLLAAAVNGHTEAAYYLALLYKNGTGIGQSLANAFKYCQQALSVPTSNVSAPATALMREVTQDLIIMPDPKSVRASRGSRYLEFKDGSRCSVIINPLRILPKRKRTRATSTPK